MGSKSCILRGNNQNQHQQGKDLKEAHKLGASTFTRKRRERRYREHNEPCTHEKSIWRGARRFNIVNLYTKPWLTAGKRKRNRAVECTLKQTKRTPSVTSPVMVAMKMYVIRPPKNKKSMGNTRARYKNTSSIGFTICG